MVHLVVIGWMSLCDGGHFGIFVKVDSREEIEVDIVNNRPFVEQMPKQTQFHFLHVILASFPIWFIVTNSYFMRRKHVHDV